MKRLLFPLAVLAGAALLTGCDAPPTQTETVFPTEEPDKVLLIGLDVSGSFNEKLFGKDARAFNYTTRAFDTYANQQAGNNVRVVIFQIGGPEKGPLLWDGTPQSFRQEFRSADDFKQYIKDRSSPNGSRVFRSIADSLDYCLAAYQGKTRFCALLFTDWDDNVGERAENERRLSSSLAAFGKRNGSAIGVYWVSQLLIGDANRVIKGAGIKQSVVYSEIVSAPPLPNWEE